MKRSFPIEIVPEMMQNSRCQDDIILLLRQFNSSKVPLKNFYFSRIDNGNSGMCSFKHGLTQVNQVTIKGRNKLQKFKRVIAGSTPNIEHSPDMRGACNRSSCD